MLRVRVGSTDSTQQTTHSWQNTYVRCLLCALRGYVPRGLEDATAGTVIPTSLQDSRTAGCSGLLLPNSCLACSTVSRAKLRKPVVGRTRLSRRVSYQIRPVFSQAYPPSFVAAR